MLASADEDGLRHSVLGLAVSHRDRGRPARRRLALRRRSPRRALWALALFLDMGGPYFFGAEGWRLVPGHFAERHGLIVIIALGESIVAIGVGAAGALDLGIGTAAVLGVALAAALWWTYFDVVALVSARRLARGRARPAAERARPRLLLLHPPRAGRRHRPRRLRDRGDDRPHRRPPAHRARLRPARRRRRSTCSAWSASATATSATVNRHRLGLAIVLLLLIPVATAIPALLTLALVDLAAGGDDRPRAPAATARAASGAAARNRRSATATPLRVPIWTNVRGTFDFDILPSLDDHAPASRSSCCAPAPPRATRNRRPRSGARPPPSPTSSSSDGARLLDRPGRRARAAAGGRRPHRRDRPGRHPHRREGLPLLRPDRRLGPADPGRPAGRA